MKKLHRPRLRRDLKRKPINVLASAITTFSLYLGLASIFWTIREEYDRAAYFILYAIICDMLDGTVARLTKSTSEFGKELDSLCDLVSFGVAPAVLIYGNYLCEEQMAGTIAGRTGAFMAIVFAICGALRLARFNVFQSAQRDYFTGLPIPAAGGTVATFVLFTEYMHLRVAFWVLGPMTITLAFLMVSTVRYPKDRIKKELILAPQNAILMLVLCAIAIGVFHSTVTLSPAIFLFPLCATYVLFGMGDTLVSMFKRWKSASAHSEVQALPPPEAQSTPGAPVGPK